jgi:hypothetical protein
MAELERSKMLSLDKAKDAVERVIAKWQTENSPERLAERVNALLNQHIETIVLGLIGFTRDNWGNHRELKVDHCNGQSTVVREYVKGVARDAINTWLNENMDKLPTLPDSTKKALRTSYLETYAYQLREQLHDLAEKRAKQDAESLLDSFGLKPLQTGVTVVRNTKDAYRADAFDDL